MFCFPCYVFSFKLLLNHLELNFYYDVEVEALVPSFDLNVEYFSLRFYLNYWKQLFK